MLDLNVLGVVGTFVFGLLSVVLYFRGKRRKRLSVEFSFRTFQRKDHPDVQLLYRGTEIDSLSRGELVFWNSGSVAVRGADVPSLAPLVFSLPPDCRLLSRSLLKVSNAANRFEVGEHSPHSLRAHFDYLNPGEGAMVEVLFDRSGSEAECRFTLEGALIGGVLHSSSGNEERTLSDSTRAFLVAGCGTFLGFVLPIRSGEGLALSGTLETVALPVGLLAAALAVAYVAFPRSHRPPIFSSRPSGEAA